MKKRELLYERSFNDEFYQRLCIARLRSHLFHAFKERTHKDAGSSKKIESSQVFHFICRNGINQNKPVSRHKCLGKIRPDFPCHMFYLPFLVYCLFTH